VRSQPASIDWTKPVVAIMLVGHAMLMLIAIVWWVLNLETLPDYGDSRQYLRLAESLRVDDFRTLFYPLILRGLKTPAMFCGCRVELLAYLVQTVLALTSIAYLGRALWDLTAETEKFSQLKRVSALRRQAVIGAFAMLVFSRPLINHFALSVMTDSLAASFTTAGLAALIRVSTLGDTRLRTVVIGCLAIAAAGFMRAEKVYVMGLTIVLALAAAWWLARSTMSSHRGRVLAYLTLLLLIPGIAVTAINRATQIPGYYGWPPVTTDVRLFVRAVWPRLTQLRPLLSQKFRAVVSEKDAKAFDHNYNEYLRLVPLLQQHAGGTNVLVNEASWVAIRHHGREIASTTAMDALRYAVPLIAYPADIHYGSGKRASNWTHTRMRAATPLLTDAYLWAATGLLFIIQIPVVLTLLIQLGGSWNQRVMVAVGLLLAVSIINAILYAAGNGLQNVRYALPAVYLVFAAIVWGNFVWLAARCTDGRTNRARRASDPTRSGSTRSTTLSIRDGRTPFTPRSAATGGIFPMALWPLTMRVFGRVSPDLARRRVTSSSRVRKLPGIEPMSRFTASIRRG